MIGPLAHAAHLVPHLVLAGLVAGAGATTDGTAHPGPPPATSHRADVAPAAGPAPGPSPRPGGLTPEAGVWPLDPRPEVVSGFDPPASAYAAGHRGVDLAGSPGQAVRAALGGRVTYAGSLAGRGVVVVSHGDSRTTYEPVEPSVRVGEVVEAGAVLGRLQLAGSHCRPAACLHWGLLEGEEYRDPLRLVGVGPVRLLPWVR